MKNHDKETTVYLRDCPPHTVKLGFMCIPICLSEMSVEKIKQLKEDKNYCVEDYINTGMAFYDFH